LSVHNKRFVWGDEIKFKLTDLDFFLIRYRLEFENEFKDKEKGDAFGSTMARKPTL